MKDTVSEPFHPCVTWQEILHFDKDRPETYTSSPLINAVLRAVAAVGPHSSKAICDYMQVSGRKLWPAVELLTGMKPEDFRLSIVYLWIDRMTAEHPDWSSDMVAHALGYKSRANLFQLLGRKEYNDEISNKRKPIRYYYSRKKKQEEELWQKFKESLPDNQQ